MEEPKRGELKWRPHPEQCPKCGYDSEIKSVFEEEGWGYDGDAMRCTHCGLTGQWSVFDQDAAYTDWGEWEWEEE